MLFLRFAPCKAILLLPTIKAKSICATCFYMYSMYVYIPTAPLTLITNGQLLSSLEPIIYLSPWPHDFLFMCCRPRTAAGVTNRPVSKRETRGSLGWISALCWAFGPGQSFLDTGSKAVKHILLILNLLKSVKAKPFQPTIWKWSWSQRPKKQVINKPLFLGGRKYTLVFNMLAAMVIAQTSVQQQHINPSWPSILTCDKRRKRRRRCPPFPLHRTFEYPGTSRPLRAHGH